MVKILKRKVIIFYELLPFENLDIESLVSQKLLQLGDLNLNI